MQTKKSIIDSTKKHNFKIKKYYGQCFLSDSLIVSKIASLSDIKEDTTVLEIGPGTGAMTEELIKYAKKVVAYEIDSDVIPILKENLNNSQKLEVINSDILKADLSYINSLDGDVISVSNLPYYITSPIIDLFLKKLKNVRKGVFMVQKEVADRICAKVGTKDYNAFSIMVQYYANTKKILNVPRSCFTPSPNVDSAVIEIEKRERENKPKDDELFERIVVGSFKERRKTLLNNLSSCFNLSKEVVKDILSSIDINIDSRAETLSIDDFIKLSNEVGKQL